MKKLPSRRAGFTLVEIMIVVGIIGMLVALAMPAFLKAQATAQKNTCINNLRQLDAAKHQWALESGYNSAVVPSSSALVPYIHRGTGAPGHIYCPQDPTRTMANSYSIEDLVTAPYCRMSFTHTLPK